MKKTLEGRWVLEQFEQDRLKDVFLSIWKDEVNSCNEEAWVRAVIIFLEMNGYEVSKKDGE